MTDVLPERRAVAADWLEERGRNALVELLNKDSAQLAGARDGLPLRERIAIVAAWRTELLTLTEEAARIAPPVVPATKLQQGADALLVVVRRVVAEMRRVVGRQRKHVGLGESSNELVDPIDDWADELVALLPVESPPEPFAPPASAPEKAGPRPSLTDPCPAPHRNGHHEIYIFNMNAVTETHACRACGANRLAGRPAPEEAIRRSEAARRGWETHMTERDRTET